MVVSKRHMKPHMKNRVKVNEHALSAFYCNFYRLFSLSLLTDGHFQTHFLFMYLFYIYIVVILLPWIFGARVFVIEK